MVSDILIITGVTLLCLVWAHWLSTPAPTQEPEPAAEPTVVYRVPQHLLWLAANIGYEGDHLYTGSIGHRIHCELEIRNSQIAELREELRKAQEELQVRNAEADAYQACYELEKQRWDDAVQDVERQAADGKKFRYTRMYERFAQDAKKVPDWDVILVEGPEVIDGRVVCWTTFASKTPGFPMVKVKHTKGAVNLYEVFVCGTFTHCHVSSEVVSLVEMKQLCTDALAYL